MNWSKTDLRYFSPKKLCFVALMCAESKHCEITSDSTANSPGSDASRISAVFCNVCLEMTQVCNQLRH